MRRIGHRDLKPGNVASERNSQNIVPRRGEALAITDFGAERSFFGQQTWEALWGCMTMGMRYRHVSMVQSGSIEPRGAVLWHDSPYPHSPSLFTNAAQSASSVLLGSLRARPGSTSGRFQTGVPNMFCTYPEARASIRSSACREQDGRSAPLDYRVAARPTLPRAPLHRLVTVEKQIVAGRCHPLQARH